MNSTERVEYSNNAPLWAPELRMDPSCFDCRSYRGLGVGRDAVEPGIGEAAGKARELPRNSGAA